MFDRDRFIALRGTDLPMKLIAHALSTTVRDISQFVERSDLPRRNVCTRMDPTRAKSCKLCDGEIRAVAFTHMYLWRRARLCGKRCSGALNRWLVVARISGKPRGHRMSEAARAARAARRARTRPDRPRVGKRTAGRLLDGVTHDGFPAA